MANAVRAPEADMKSPTLECSTAKSSIAEVPAPEPSVAESSGPDSETSKPESTAAEPTAVKPPITVFHPDADLQVIVTSPNSDAVIYMVRASALTCVSPVWRSEIKDKEIQTLELGDNPEAIGIIFHIAHHNYSEVPEKPTLDQLFELGKSACQYECTHLFYPWATKWVSNLFTIVGQDHCFDECHKAIYIAWTFGELELFRDMIDALVVSSKSNTGGMIVNICGKRLDEMHMPPDLVGIITNARVTTVEKILGAVGKPLDAISNRDEDEKNTYCKVGKDGKACELIMLGSAIAALTKAGLFPVPGSGQYKGSISDLKKSLVNVKAVPYCGKDWMPHLSHDHCTLGLDRVVLDCLKEMDIRLTDGMMSWMSVQAGKCGIKATTELTAWREKQENDVPKTL